MSPVILLGLVVMWAVVLVPMWLRRHDEAEETRSVDKFTTAMHTLSRREALAPEKKYVLMPHRSRSYDVHVSGASADPKHAHESRKAARPIVSAATRRRRTLIGLLVATVLTLVLTVVIRGLATLALQLITDACLVAFVLHLRNRAQRAAVVRRSRPAPARRAAEPRVQPRVEPEVRYDEDIEEEFEPVPVAVPVAAGAEDVIFDQTVSPEVAEAGQPDAGFEPADTDGTFDQSSDEHVQRTVVMASSGGAPMPAAEVEIAAPEPAPEVILDDEGGIGARPWEPVPVPKPVYASKPAAPVRRRSAPTFDPLLPPVDSPAELDQVDDLEEILDRRWAVND